VISIIIPTKNGERFISRAIESVLSQNEKDLEIVVVDDASTDNSRQVVESLIKKESRIKLISNQVSLRTGKSRDLGIKNSRGEYIALIDDDDLWIDLNKIFVQKKFLEENPEYVLVGAERVQQIDESGKLINYYHNPVTDKEIRSKMLERSCFITSSVMFRKKTYEEVGGFRDIYRAEDYDLWLRLGRLGKMANIKAEIAYRIRKSSNIQYRKWYKEIKSFGRVIYSYLFKKQ